MASVTTRWRSMAMLIALRTFLSSNGFFCVLR
jgi:hypothetical protein